MTPTNKPKRTALFLILFFTMLGITLANATTEDNYKNETNLLPRISETTHTENGYKANIIINPYTIGIYAKENSFNLDLTVNPKGIGGALTENNYQLDLIPEKTFPCIQAFDVVEEVIEMFIFVEDQPYASYIRVNVTVWSDQEYLNASVHARFLWGATEVGFTLTTVDIPSGINTTIQLPPWDSLICSCPREVIGENINVTVTLKTYEGETLCLAEATFIFMQPDKELLWERLTELITAWPTASQDERDRMWDKIVKIVTLYPTAP